MKHLPLGKQDFKSIVENNLLYVDKTEIIYHLLHGSYYFLSRPRRFGKSLLISTLKYIFQGEKELFKDLWIYDKIDWQEHPVIHISFSDISHKELGLRSAIDLKLDEIIKENKLTVVGNAISYKFREIIRALGKKQKVVILIDEYDKPIIDYIENTDKAKENREILKELYSVIKDSDEFLRFFLITGVSKFSRVSIFSDLNNLEDITIDRRFGELTGISQAELEHYFEEHIIALKEEVGEYYDNIEDEIQKEYLGYSWDGKTTVYNPFTLLNLFTKLQFSDFWFQSGTPTFLMKLIKEEKYTTFDLENKKVFLSTFDKYEIDDISLLSLLFQTGYLTITEFDIRKNAIRLGFPNREVDRSFSIHLLAALNGGKTTKTNSFLLEMTEAIEENRIKDFIKYFKILLKGISYTIADNKEAYYHSIFYLVVKMMGFNIQSEIITIDGRIDAVLFTEKIIYILEFKTGNTIKAIKQIREKKYYEPYINDPRPIQLLGIDFDVEKKCIAEYELEDL